MIYKKHFLFWLKAVVGIAALVCISLNSAYQTGIVNDDALNVLGARSLFEGFFIHSELLRPDYPLPGLPLFLAPLVKIIEPNWTSLEWVMIAVAVCMLYLLGLWVSRYLSGPQALAVVALVGFNPLITKFSGLVMPSILFVACALVSFLLMARLGEKWSHKEGLALGFLLGWAAVLRPEGVILGISVLSAWALSPARRKTLPVVLLPFLFWGLLMFLWWKRFPAVSTGYGGDLLALKEFWGQDFTTAVLFTRNIVHTLFIYPLVRWPEATSFHVGWGVLVLSVLYGGLVWSGARALWLERPDDRAVLFAMGLFCGLYFTVHLFWHVAVPRYAIALLPFMVFLMVRGFHAVFAPKPARIIGALAMAILLGIYAHRNTVRLYDNAWDPNPLNVPPWGAFDWIRQNTTPEDTIMSGIAPSVELYTGRRSFPGMNSGNVEMFVYQLHHRDTDFILDREVPFLAQGIGATDDPNKAWMRFRIRFMAYPEIFQKVYEDVPGRTRIYKVTEDPSFANAYEKVKVGYAQYQANRLPEALKTAQSALSLYPRFASACSLIGAIYWRANQIPEAEQFFLKSVEYMPTSIHSMMNLATIYHQTGREMLAQTYLERARAVTAAKGEQNKFEHTLQDVYQQWSQKRAYIFLDVP